MPLLTPLIRADRDGDHLDDAREHYRITRAVLDDLATPDDSIPIRPEYLARLIDQAADDDAVFVPDVGSPIIWAARFLTMNGKRNDCCQQYTEPTAEQIAADVAEIEAILALMRVVLAAVKPWRTWTKVNRVSKQEVIECPVCKGRLQLSQAAYNGHVWGKCETKGCVQWME